MAAGLDQVRSEFMSQESNQKDENDDAATKLLKKLAEGYCECLGWPPLCTACEARVALREKEKRK